MPGLTEGAKPRARPCPSCPYRQDVPSGVWSAEEYAKLPEYDKPTGEQPIGVFMCHQRSGEVCAGWAGCHDMEHTLALRLVSINGVDAEACCAYVPPVDVPLFASGAEAAEHGMRDLEDPSPEARELVAKLVRLQDRQRA